MRDLTGRVCIVTGAGSGIGRAVATRMAADGGTVVLVDVHEDAAADAVAEITAAGGTAVAMAADVTDEGAVRAATERTVETFGGLHVAVVNAGIQLFGRDAKVTDLDLEVWERTIRVNLTGAFISAKHFMRALVATAAAPGAPAGSMIFTGSPTAIRGSANGFSAYSASKAGVHGLMRVVASDFADSHVRVNAVIPGYTDSPLVADLRGTQDQKNLIATIPFGRPGTVSEIAAVHAFLASDDASYCTGAMFTADGGMTAV